MSVDSVNGKTGVVTLTSTDVAQHGIDDSSRHSGVSGATAGNLLAFDSNGLPCDSTY